MVYDDPSTTIDEDKIDDAGQDNGTSDNGDFGKLLAGLITAVITIVFVPFIIIASLFYALFRFLRLKRSVLATLGLIVTAIGTILMMALHPVSQIDAAWNSMGGFNGILHGYGTLVSPVIISAITLGLILGPWVGILLVQHQIRQMRKFPFLTTVEGVKPWMYHFEFRLTPLEIYRKQKTIKSMKEDTLVPYGNTGNIPLGIEDKPMNMASDPTKERRWVPIIRNENEVVKHTIITGAAGSGKTKTMLSCIKRDIDSGKTTFIIDNKNDPELASGVAHMARERQGTHFYHFSVNQDYKVADNPDGPATWDPLAHGSVSIKADMLLGTRVWDKQSEVYRQNALTYLSEVFSIIEEARKIGILDKVPEIDTTQGEFPIFSQMLDPGNMNAVINAMNKIEGASYIRQMASELNALLNPMARNDSAKRVQQARSEYQSVVKGIMSSEYGRWLRSNNGTDCKSIDIFKLASEPNNVVLFSLDAATSQSRGAFIGSLVCTDISNMSSSRGNAGQINPVSVYIDEFQSLPPTCVKSILEKGRSAKTGVTLAFQSLKQIEEATGTAAYISSLLDTCSNFIFHAGSNYDTGMMAAKIIGTHKIAHYSVMKRNQQMLGVFNWNNNRNFNVNIAPATDEWIIDPSEFAHLSMPSDENNYKSEAIIIKKNSYDRIDKNTSGAVAHKVIMIPPYEVLENYYDPSMAPMDIIKPSIVGESAPVIKREQTDNTATRKPYSINNPVDDNTMTKTATPSSKDRNTGHTAVHKSRMIDDTPVMDVQKPVTHTTDHQKPITNEDMSLPSFDINDDSLTDFDPFADDEPTVTPERPNIEPGSKASKRFTI
jgi:hypothetical protein